MKASKLMILAGITLIFSSCEKEELEIFEDTINPIEAEVERERPQSQRGNNNNKIKVCHTNAKMLSIDYHAAYMHLEHGDILFSCNPSDGVAFNDIKSVLEQKVSDNNVTMKKAFEDWYVNDYLTGNWNQESDEDNTSGGSGGVGSGGIGGGGL